MNSREELDGVIDEVRGPSDLATDKNRKGKKRRPSNQNGVEGMTYDIWMFPKMVVPQNGWFIMDKSIKMDDLGVPPF